MHAYQQAASENLIFLQFFLCSVRYYLSFRFGELVNLWTGDDFLSAVDQEDKAVTVIVLLQVSL